MDKKFELWLNVKITDEELAKKLDDMCKSDKRTRSDFIRLLVAREFEERASALIGKESKDAVVKYIK